MKQTGNVLMPWTSLDPFKMLLRCKFGIESKNDVRMLSCRHVFFIRKGSQITANYRKVVQTTANLLPLAFVCFIVV